MMIIDDIYIYIQISHDRCISYILQSVANPRMDQHPRRRFHRQGFARAGRVEPIKVWSSPEIAKLVNIPSGKLT